MKIAAVLGGLALLVAAAVLLYQIGATRDALQTTPAAPPATEPIAAAAPGNIPIPVALPTAVAPPILAPAPSPPPAAAPAEVVPSIPPAARPPTGGTRFANPAFSTDPQLRMSVTEAEATRVAEGGITAFERRNAVEWIMAHGGADTYAVLQRVKSSDPDPGVRTAAEMGANVMQSRFPQFMGH